MVLLGVSGGVVAVFAMACGVAAFRARRAAHRCAAVAGTAIVLWSCRWGRRAPPAEPGLLRRGGVRRRLIAHAGSGRRLAAVRRRRLTHRPQLRNQRTGRWDVGVVSLRGPAPVHDLDPGAADENLVALRQHLTDARGGGRLSVVDAPRGGHAEDVEGPVAPSLVVVHAPAVLDDQPASVAGSTMSASREAVDLLAELEELGVRAPQLVHDRLAFGRAHPVWHEARPAEERSDGRHDGSHRQKRRARGDAPSVSSIG